MMEVDLGQFSSQLKEVKFPRFREVIDYCTLHGTTRDENYRRLALDVFRQYGGG